MSMFWGIRSRHSARKVRSHHGSQASGRSTRKDEDDEEAAKPGIDELRQKRTAYYSASPAERRTRSKTSSTSTTRTSTSKTASTLRSRHSKSSTGRSDASERRHRRRSYQERPERSHRSVTNTQARTEDYVYGSSRPVEPKVASAEHKSSDRRTRSTRNSRVLDDEPDLSPVEEDDVYPEDSISQVSTRPRSTTSRASRSAAPSLKRSSTASARLPSISEQSTEPASPVKSRRQRDSVSLMDTLMRRHSTPSVALSPALVECLTCGSDDVPSTQSAKLACGHRMCHDCLKRIFNMSVKDPAHMPPKCCTNDHIPLKHVDKLFDDRFKLLWNRKFLEYNTQNRIYCPTPRCGHWIKPSHIRTVEGRKYAQCPRCHTKVCTSCNNRMHRSRDCPKDPEIAKIVEQAKEKGWQRCFSCNAMVELAQGCNHMTCRCTAEFCMLCGAKWKTCECPWFNYSNLPNPDRLTEMRVPEPIQIIFRRAFAPPADLGGPADPAQPPANRVGNRRSGVPPEVTYQEEMDQRRRQERLDGDLARRLQLASLIGGDDELLGRRRTANIETCGLGNAAEHFMNDDFVQNAANVVMSAFGDANLGRRGERSSGRRRRARPTDQNAGDDGLASNFLGDESVLGMGPAARS